MRIFPLPLYAILGFALLPMAQNLTVAQTLTMASDTVTVAIIDSGTDVQHQALKGQVWTNPLDQFNGRDEDGNDYRDDVYGWNFAESNNRVIERKYIGTFSADTYKFFEVQGRLVTGTATQADRDWMNEIRKNPKAIQELQKFGNFVHGTHVAGIAAKDLAQVRLLTAKIIPTEVLPSRFTNLAGNNLQENNRDALLKTALDRLAFEQGQMLIDVAEYLNGHKVKVANGSFGTGFAQAKLIVSIAYRAIFWKKPDEAAVSKYGNYFISSLIKQGERMAAAAPNTLFVFAAGNDGANNSEYGIFPANVRASNVISVAATYENRSLASFSNYGKLVHVAAPGVIINSTIPGDKFLLLSGTSQAAPNVAYVAAQILSQNPNLAPSDVKKILMGTVFKKTFLKGKTSTQGVVSLERAKMASNLSRAMDLDQAIADANTRILAPTETSIAATETTNQIKPIPLLPLFDVKQ